MFRVSRAEERSRIVITVDGQLSGDYIGVVETCCDQERAKGKPVHLFLRDLTAVDKAGRALLGRLAAKGVRLLASGVYTSYIVQTVTPIPPRTETDDSVRVAGSSDPSGGRDINS